jgi:hypothetical protein
MTAHASRWGYHPCDYATFLLLKRLNVLCLRARRRHAQWQRWRRKRPCNRLLRQAVRDERGRKVGTRVVGPWPEPRLCPAFCARRQFVRHVAEDGSPAPAGREVEEMGFCDHDIPRLCRAARRPALSPESVEPLPLPAEEIVRLVADAEAFFRG